MRTLPRSAGGVFARAALALAFVVGLFVATLPHAQAASKDLFFSEYIEGSSNNKALEIYNGTGAPVDLATGAYNVQMYFNGGATASLTINLTGVVASGDVFVLAQSSASASILAQVDQTNGAGWFNGDDAVVLRKGTTVIDSIGQVGVDPGTEWGSGLTSTADNTLRRKSSITEGDTNPDDAFDPSIEWDGYATDTFDGLGSHTVDGSTMPTAIPTTTPATCSAADVMIGSVQGSGETSPDVGQTVTVQGVVVGDYEGASPALRGFYLEDAGDGNPATSDGIFVFEGDSANRVNVGDVVQVTGPVSEYQGQTQISSTKDVQVCGSKGTVAPVDVQLPFPGADYPERFEGMLVRFPKKLYVTEHYQLGRFGQVLLSSDGRLHQPTNVVAPGAAAKALQSQNDLNQIIVDDALNNQNPDPIELGRGGQPLSASNTLRGGDTVTGVVGTMTYTWGGNSASPNAYRVRPIGSLGGGAPDFQPANPRPMAPPAVDGSVRVVGMNLLNFFNTFSGCTNGVNGAATDCRGADNQTEFDRQWPKTVAAIVAMNPDVLGVNELENDGYGSNSAIQFLVDKLNAATAPGTYAFINADAATGQTNALGTDAIKVSMLYKPSRVTPVGQTAVLNTDAFVNGGDTSPRSRPSLAQAFEENATGGRFIVDINHLKSKGSACDMPDAGDGQGNCNAERVKAATELVKWLASDPTGINDPDVLLIGDYNSYAMEDPITTIKNAGYTNLIAKLIGRDAYSYVFDGQWGYLDHALASASMTSQVVGVAEYHINSDEPSVLDYNTNFKSANQQNTLYAPDQYRVSDHDPVVVGLDLDNDNDGILDANDPFPQSNRGSNVVIAGCDSGVRNLDIGDGSTFLDRIGVAVANAKNHGQFVSAVSGLTNDWKKAGLISGAEKGAIQQCAAQSNIGK